MLAGAWRSEFNAGLPGSNSLLLHRLDIQRGTSYITHMISIRAGFQISSMISKAMYSIVPSALCFSPVEISTILKITAPYKDVNAIILGIKLFHENRLCICRCRERTPYASCIKKFEPQPTPIIIFTKSEAESVCCRPQQCIQKLSQAKLANYSGMPESTLRFHLRTSSSPVSASLLVCCLQS